jgi:hypothetical protein
MIIDSYTLDYNVPTNIFSENHDCIHYDKFIDFEVVEL